MSAPIVIVVRDPDHDNAYHVFDGPVQTIDIDLGRSDLDDYDEAVEWAHAHIVTACELAQAGRTDAASLVTQLVIEHAGPQASLRGAVLASIDWRRMTSEQTRPADPTNGGTMTGEQMAERLNDAWAVLRCVSPQMTADALATHDRDSDQAGLADDVLDAARALRHNPNVALLTLWKLEGGECSHGVGLEGDCDDDCDHQPLRPALRAAMDAIS